MALVKCPECGHDVSTKADACPHCGYPINKQSVATSEKVIKEDYPEPIDPSWTTEWNKKVRKTRLIFLLGWLGCVLLFVLFVVLYNVVLTKETYSSGHVYYRNKPIFIPFMVFFGVLSFGFIFVLIMVLIQSRIVTRKYDGYTILVCVALKSYLVIENKVQSTTVFNRYMYGELPNGKHVWATISAWDASVKMGIGSEHDEKQIL